MVIFAGQENSEFEEVAVYQRGVSREVATLHAWVAVVINTVDGEKRYNALHFDALHALVYPSDPQHIVDDQLDESHLEASEV